MSKQEFIKPWSLWRLDQFFYLGWKQICSSRNPQKLLKRKCFTFYAVVKEGKHNLQHNVSKLQQQVKKLENCLGCLAETEMNTPSSLSIDEVLRCSRLAVDVGSSTNLLTSTRNRTPFKKFQPDDASRKYSAPRRRKQNYTESWCWFILPSWAHKHSKSSQAFDGFTDSLHTLSDLDLSWPLLQGGILL